MTRAARTVTEQEARRLGREAGYKSARRAKRSAWTLDDAAAAIAEYRRLTGRPGATVEAAKAALADLTGAVGSVNDTTRP